MGKISRFCSEVVTITRYLIYMKRYNTVGTVLPLTYARVLSRTRHMQDNFHEREWDVNPVTATVQAKENAPTLMGYLVGI